MTSQPCPAGRRATQDRPRLKVFNPNPAMTDNATLAAPTGSPGADAPVAEYPHSPLPAEGQAQAGYRPLVCTPELLAELAAVNVRLEHAQPEEIIAWAA